MKRWYVTITWHDWPEGGSYGEIVEAETAEDAEAQVRLLMADSIQDAWDEKDGVSMTDLVEEYAGQWHLVDCWDVDEFVERNRR